MAILLTKYRVRKGENDMKIKINSHATTVKPSIIREMKVLADSYKNVIDFTLGEPHISHHTYETIHEGLHQRIMRSPIGYSHQYWRFRIKRSYRRVLSNPLQSRLRS